MFKTLINMFFDYKKNIFAAHNIFKILKLIDDEIWHLIDNLKLEYMSPKAIKWMALTYSFVTNAIYKLRGSIILYWNQNKLIENPQIHIFCSVC
jgi:hypothetical protein